MRASCLARRLRRPGVLETRRRPNCQASGCRAARLGLQASIALAMALTLAPSVLAQTAQPGVPETGTGEAEALFRFPLGGVVTAGPSIAAGKVWLLSDSRTLYVLTVDGVAIGKKTLPERRAAYIVCDDFGRAAISSGQSGMALVNKAGREVWRVELGVPPSHPPIFASDGRMFVACATSLFAYAPNGSRLWKASLPAAVSTALVIGPGGGPALGLVNGSVALFQPDGGEPSIVNVGSEPLALAVCGPLLAAALESGRLLVFSPEHASAPAPGAAAARPTSSAAFAVASAPAPGAAAVRPISPVAAELGARPVAITASEEAIFALGRNSTLLAISPDGRELWRQSVRLDGGPATLAAFDGRLVLVSRSAVRSFGADGSPYRALTLSNVASMPVMSPGGAVFAGGSDWILYAYRFERPLTASATPRIAPLDLALIDAMAAEEAVWTIAPHSDASALERLTDIEKNLKSGTIGVDTRRTALYLAAVALGRMDAPFGSGAAPSGILPSGPLPRVQACALLGSMGLTLAVPALVMAFEDDPEPAVRAAAAGALAQIGLDPEGRAMGAFARASEKRMDERTAAAVVMAIDAMYRASGALDDRSGMLALLRIAGGNYPSQLRTMAEQALRRVSTAR